jgi:hypothetical protein
MKNILKYIIGIVSTLFSLQAVANIESNNILHSHYQKDKPIPEYKVDVENKQIIFIDLDGFYMIDNDHIDVVMSGEVREKNYTLDISTLRTGIYLLEIEHKGYIYTEEIILE